MSNLFVKAKDFLFRSRKAPSRTTTQAAHVRDRLYGGSTKAMAAAYGVAPRTVARWIAGTRHPVRHADRLRDEAARVQTTARGRERRARELERRGDRSGISARIGRTRTFQVQGSDAIRARDAYLDLTGPQAAALARATTEADIEAALKEALADYFNAGAIYARFQHGDFIFDPGDVDYYGNP